MYMDINISFSFKIVCTETKPFSLHYLGRDKTLLEEYQMRLK